MRLVYWGTANQLMDFMTIENTAVFTAAAALDDHTPRFLRIAGHVASARDLADIASRVFGEQYSLFRAGPLSRLEKSIRFTRWMSKGERDVYPPWQEMQYMHNMYDGRAKLQPLDNARYDGIQWTSIGEVLSGSPEGSHSRAA